MVAKTARLTAGPLSGARFARYSRVHIMIGPLKDLSVTCSKEAHLGRRTDNDQGRIGRSKNKEKRSAILRAARALFFARGLDSTTIEDIAAAAQVSKVTVYGHFGDKETLLEAVIRAEASRVEQALIRPRARAAPLADVLNAFGETLLGFLTSPEMEACDRLLASEAARLPALAKRFYEAGPGYVHRQLAGVLAEAAARDEIATAEPMRAAEDLIGLWEGMMLVERRFGIIRSPNAAELASRARRGTAIFLRAQGFTAIVSASPTLPRAVQSQ